jgi:hypothetical protein
VDRTDLPTADPYPIVDHRALPLEQLVRRQSSAGVEESRDFLTNRLHQLWIGQSAQRYRFARLLWLAVRETLKQRHRSDVLS